ncbi:AAA family ATPase [Candidatus Ventrimonas sp.]|uniref:AAA family ATPase n=1 Tax=Candidatus Ventrimonas sp. TaxID=3048889 RepID=UPI003AB64411
MGEIVRGKRSEVGYRKPDSDKVLSVRNLSMGLKTFVILKLLLEKGVIEQNGVVILDEPEIHLHPEWQLLFAELIVLIQREFEIHVLLNTHSPYFLNAIEVYSAKYGIADQCKYYLSSSDGVAARIEDVTNCIEKIYSKLAKPLQTLENERGRL